ncbi:MAG: transposase [Candidatus Saccharibacteria bacterium]|nr:transposase [Pseudorhodobacter sp.]
MPEPKRVGGRPLTLAYGWAHARRKRHDISQKDGSEIAAEGLRRFADIYKIQGQDPRQDARPAPRRSPKAIRPADCRLPPVADKTTQRRSGKRSHRSFFDPHNLRQIPPLERSPALSTATGRACKSSRPTAAWSWTSTPAETPSDRSPSKKALFAPPFGILAIPKPYRATGHVEGGHTGARIAYLIKTRKINSIAPYA